MSGRRIFTRPARLAAIAPYLWIGLFFLVPLMFVIKISLSQTAIAQPPYLPVFDLTAGVDAIKSALAALSLDNFRLLVSDDLYVLSYLRSLEVAAISTAILLLIGYPIAYGMARLPPRRQSVAMMLVIVPFWTSFLIRIYAWINILQHDGLLNQVLLALHVVSAPIVWLSTDNAMYLGIVYSYLPFMILPLYATLAKMDPALHVPAVAAGRRSRRSALLHSHCRRVRDSRFVGWLRYDDDRPDLVARILHQQGLAGGFRHGRRPPASAARATLAVRPPATATTGAGLMATASNRLSLFNVTALALGLAFLYLPIVILIIYSFNASRLVTVWGGWSLQWYGEFFNDSAMIDAAWMSLRVAATSASLATLLGTLAAVALSRSAGFKGRTLFSSMLYAPLVMPEVITGLSLLLLFVALNAERGFWTVVIAHTTLTMSFVAVVVQARLGALDRR